MLTYKENNPMSVLLSQKRLSAEQAKSLHIEQFWNPQNHPSLGDPRDFALNRIEYYTRRNRESIENLSCSQALLIRKLIRVGNQQTAEIAIDNPNLLDYELLVKAVAEEYEARSRTGDTILEKWLDIPLSEVRNELNCVEDMIIWKKDWEDKLRQLNLEDK
jgi:hypothetical protein